MKVLKSVCPVAIALRLVANMLLHPIGVSLAEFFNLVSNVWHALRS